MFAMNRSNLPKQFLCRLNFIGFGTSFTKNAWKHTAAAMGTTTAPHRRKTAAGLIIGDEILTGKTLDRNSQFLAQQCFDAGLELKRLVTIADDEDTIIEQVRRLSASFDHVFTSGGIGPTHDDITYASIAKAFDLPLQEHPETLDRMTRHFSSRQPPVPITEARRRMALLPAINKPIASVFYTANEDPEDRTSAPLWVPLVTIHNVHILPGIPSLYQHMLKYYFRQVLVASLRGDHARRHRRLFGTALGEGDLAEQLTRVHVAFKGRVQLGSYPNWRLMKLRDQPQRSSTVSGDGDGSADPTVRVVITMEGDRQQDVDDCAKMLTEVLPVQELNEDRTKKTGK